MSEFCSACGAKKPTLQTEKRWRAAGRLPPAPRIPPTWPADSSRRAAMEESGDGFCACCDLPIPLKANGKRVSRYHCGRDACAREWARLGQEDGAREYRKKKARRSA